MASLPPLGEAYVEVSADLRKLFAGFKEAEAATARFERSLKSKLGGSTASTAQSTDKLAEAERRLARSLDSAAASASRFANNLTRVGSESKKAAGQVENSSVALRRTLLATASTLGAAFGLNSIRNLADSYTRFTNQLKVAGIEGQDLARAQTQLFDIAQRYGVQVESLGNLYGRLSQAQKELGASGAQIMQMVNGVGAALKVQGAGTQEARGALIQLTQALGGEIVRAEEFNSINEGARPILVAVARGIDRFGGSVAKLRREVIDGKVTSAEFFQGFLRGSKDLEAQAEKANFTIGQSFIRLQNALSQYIGQTDQAVGVTQGLASAMKLIADNIEAVAFVAEVLVLALGAKYIAAAGRATAVTIGMTAANAKASASAMMLATSYTMAATGAGRIAVSAATATASISRMSAVMLAARAVGASFAATLSNLVGGAPGVAIMVLAGAILNWRNEVDKTKTALERLKGSNDESITSLEIARDRLKSARDETKRVGDSSKDAQDGIRGLGDAMGYAADKAKEMAAEAKKAAIEAAKLRRLQLQEDIGRVQQQLVPRQGARGRLNERVGMSLGEESTAILEQRLKVGETALEKTELELRLLQQTPLTAFARRQEAIRTKSEELAAEIVSLQEDLKNAHRAKNTESMRILNGQIEERQKTLALMKTGLSYEVALATVQAKALKSAKETSERREITNREIDNALASIGAQVTSRARTPQHNRDVGGVPNSLHLTTRGGRARDIAKTAGMTENKIRQALEATGARIIELIDEGDHFHVAWAKMAKDGLAVADAAVRDLEKFQTTSASLDDNILDARQANLTSAAEIAKLAADRVNRERNREAEEIKNDQALGKYDDAAALQLLEKNEQLRAEQLRTIQLGEEERQAQERFDIAEGLKEAQIEALQLGAQMATTAEERRRLELAALAAEKELERMRLDRIIHSRDTTDAEKAIAEAKKRELDDLYRTREAQARQNTRGPLEDWLARIPRSAAEAREALERLQVEGLQELQMRTRAFADDIADAFGRAAQSILEMKNPLDILRALIGDLAQTFTQEFIITPFTDMIRRKVGAPIAEKLVGRNLPGVTASDSGLDAAAISAAYQNGVLGVNSFTAAINRAAIALDQSRVGGITPMGTEAAEVTAGFNALDPTLDQFSAGLMQVLAGVTGGGVGGGLSGIMSIAGSLIGSAFGGGGAKLLGGPSFDAIGNPFSATLTSKANLLDLATVGKYAGGGWIHGRGGPSDDANLIRASNREFMVNAPAAKEWGPFLESINSGRLGGGAFGLSRLLALGGGGRTIHMGGFNVYGASGDEKALRRTGRQLYSQVRRGVADAARDGMA